MELATPSSLPRRKFLPREATADVDEYGFLNPGQTSLSAEDLFNWQTVLIVAPPWTGKSFVANQLKSHFTRQQEQLSDDAPFGTYFTLTSFEGETFEGDKPAWWQEWLQSGRRACWILDALDEDAKDRSRGALRILNLIEDLQSEGRKRLTLLIFSREAEVPSKVQQRIEKMYGAPSDEADAAFHIIQLARLDAYAAKDFVKTDEAFSEVCRLILNNNLRSIAGYPSVLECLAKYPPGVSVSYAEVWKNVLLHLIEDRRNRYVGLPLTADHASIEEQFSAAARIAAILTFGDCELIADNYGISPYPSVDALILRDHPKGEALNRAGREVLRSSVFRQVVGGLSFAQHHVQQWLAAFGVAELSLTRLRPLLTDENGVILPHHEGVLRLLTKTSSHRDVADWITNKCLGIPPRSDAAPLELNEATAALDQIQMISKNTPWSLSLWQESGLAHLATPGLGTELARRLADQSLSRQERELMIDVAKATKAKETVTVAAGIVQDVNAPARLRLMASSLVLQLGSNKVRLALGEYARTLNVSDSDEAALKGVIVERLFERKLWDFATTVREAPPAGPKTSLLHYRLEHEMGLDDARAVLKTLNTEVLLKEIAPGPEGSRNRPHFRTGKVLLKAVSLVVEEDEPTEDDFALLHPIALTLHREEWHSEGHPHFAKVFAKNQIARRRLVRTIADQSTKETEELAWNLWGVLLPEDIDWLSELAKERGAAHPWLWRWLLKLVLYPAVSDNVREVARGLARATVSDLVSQFDQVRDEAKEREEKWEAKRRAAQKDAEKNELALADLVNGTLNNQKLSLKDQMLNLSWFCLSEPEFRPANVVGDWQSLGPEQKEAVLSVCERGLQDTEPTPIPHGNTYPIAIAYEASCFEAVVQDRGEAFPLDSELIRKWLPSAVAHQSDAIGAVLQHCWKADASATEDVLIAELRRRLQFETGSVVLEAIPTELWTPSFCASLSKLITDVKDNPGGRAWLLDVLTLHAQETAMPICIQWLQSGERQERMGAINLLLRFRPDVAWPALKKEIAERGKAAILDIHTLHSRRLEKIADLKQWNAPLLEDLIDTLMHLFPPATDPEWQDEAAYGGDEGEYRSLRLSLPQMLLNRAGQDDLKTLRNLASRHQSIANWYDHRKAEEAAAAVLKTLNPTPLTRPGTVPFAKVAKLLDSAIYRIVRTAEDLQSVLLEEIGQIQLNAKDHLSLLYRPRRGREDFKHLQEDALQAYFFCRLHDRLIGRVLDAGTTVTVDREPLTVKDQRLDIKVQAPIVSGTGSVTVVIELKWSDHPAVSTSMQKQLVAEYLLGGNLTHGIYLVGWNLRGRWGNKDVQGPQDRKLLSEWQKAFERQAKIIAHARPGISVDPVVVDLDWPPSAARKESKRNERAKVHKRATSSKRANPASSHSSKLVKRRTSLAKRGSVAKQPRRG